MKRLAWIAALLIGLLMMSLTGCKSQAVSYSAGLSDGKAWLKIFENRLHRHVFLVVIHGDADLHGGQWYTYADDAKYRMSVDDFARKLHREHWFTPVVLICCNTHKMQLHVRGVWYCRWFNATWDIPGDEWVYSKKLGEWRLAGGRFEDFEEGKP